MFTRKRGLNPTYWEGRPCSFARYAPMGGLYCERPTKGGSLPRWAGSFFGAICHRYACMFGGCIPPTSPPRRPFVVSFRLSRLGSIRFWLRLGLAVLVLISGPGLSSVGEGFGFHFWLAVFCVLGAHRRFLAFLFCLSVCRFECLHVSGGGTQLTGRRAPSVSPDTSIWRVVYDG